MRTRRHRQIVNVRHSDRRRCAPGCVYSARSSAAASAPLFSGRFGVLRLRLRAAVPVARLGRSSRLRVLKIQPQKLVPLLQVRLFDRDFRQALGMRIQQPGYRNVSDAAREAPAATSIASSSGSSKLSDTTTTTLLRRVGALQLPRHGLGMRRDFVGARLRPHPVRLNVFLEPDPPDRVGIGIRVRQMRTFAESGSRKIISAPSSCAVRNASVNGSAGSTGT